MNIAVVGLARTLAYERERKPVLYKELYGEQEDRACSLYDGEMTITIAPAPQGTIPQLWTSSGTCSCSFRRFGNSIGIRAAETLLRGIYETCCGYFSSKTVAAIVAEHQASHLSKDDTGAYNDGMPIPLHRLSAVEGGSIEPRNHARINTYLPAGLWMTGLLGIAWRACRDGFPVAPVGGEVAVSPV